MNVKHIIPKKSEVSSDGYGIRGRYAECCSDNAEKDNISRDQIETDLKQGDLVPDAILQEFDGIEVPSFKKKEEVINFIPEKGKCPLLSIKNKSVLQVLKDQPHNKLLSNKLISQIAQSDEYLLAYIPVSIAADVYGYIRNKPGSSSPENADNPIIIEMNYNDWYHDGDRRFKRIILDGQNRLIRARKEGKEWIMAYIGGKEKCSHAIYQEDINNTDLEVPQSLQDQFQWTKSLITPKEDGGKCSEGGDDSEDHQKNYLVFKEVEAAIEAAGGWLSIDRSTGKVKIYMDRGIKPKKEWYNKLKAAGYSVINPNLSKARNYINEGLNALQK